MTKKQLNDELKKAVESGNSEQIKLSLEKGADVHADGGYALCMASGRGYFGVVKLLLEHGADVHADGDYALCRASKHGHLEVVRLLLKHGANAHARGDAALQWAGCEGHLEVVKLLLRQGASVHAGDDLALRWASERGHLEIVKLLLKHGADVHASNDYALRWARYGGHFEVVKLLEHFIETGNTDMASRSQQQGQKSQQQSVQQEESNMSKLVSQVKTSAMVMKDHAVHGAEVAVSVVAKDLVVGQVRKLFGDHFPDAFYATPLGKALMDASACYLVHVAASTYPTMPGASMAAQAAELAMEGVSRDSFAPMVEAGKELLTGVASQFALTGMGKEE